MRYFVRRKWLKKIRSKGGDYLITVKDNQKHLHRRMDEEFGLETLIESNGTKIIDNEVEEYTATSTGHGRIEERRIRVMPVPSHYRKIYKDWVDMRRWCQIKRTVWKQRKGIKTVEYAYAITSLTQAQASPKRLLELNRAHWGVESFHWIKDTLLKEDASTIRTQNAPAAVATLRNMKLFFIKKIGMKPKQGHEFLFNNIKYLIKTTDWMK